MKTEFAEETIKKLTENWFLCEPILFSTYCTHLLVPNDKMHVPFRTGKRKIEYSEKILKGMDEHLIEELLKVEVLRILLKHPYQRQPLAPIAELLTMASNVTINDVNPISKHAQFFLHGLEYDLPENLCFEEYYEQLKGFFKPSKISLQINVSDLEQLNTQGADNSVSSGGQQSAESQDPATISQCHSAELSALWDEDEELCISINKIIEEAEFSNNWGSLPLAAVSLIKASRFIEMDYRRMLSYFKTSVISSKRNLTRMRPSRRYGFAAMGSRYALSTNLLIAVDVSGSVSDKALGNFFSVINRFFKYGIENLDVIQFDAELATKQAIPMRKAKSTVKILGRGGTNFQPAADFYCSHPEYDGLIYFTDGCAPPPTFNTKRPIDVLWVLCGKAEYEECKGWIKEIKRNRATYIPSPK